jgi:hypothetical protein
MSTFQRCGITNGIIGLQILTNNCISVSTNF